MIIPPPLWVFGDGFARYSNDGRQCHEHDEDNIEHEKPWSGVG